MEYTQPDLLGGAQDDPAGMSVTRPVPRRSPGWEFIPIRQQRDQCAHCVLVAAAAVPERANSPAPIRTAEWIRYGRWGSQTRLCPGHRAMQRQHDQNQPNAG